MSHDDLLMPFEATAQAVLREVGRRLCVCVSGGDGGAMNGALPRHPEPRCPEWVHFCFHASADDEPWPTLSKARINDSGVTGYAQDQSDIQHGYDPRPLTAGAMRMDRLP